MVWNRHGRRACHKWWLSVIKKLVLSFFIMLFSGVVHATPATVGYIIDGDTFAAYVNLEDGIRISVRVRIRNIDTPEIHGECESEIRRAYLAKERLSQLIPVGSDVELTAIKDDKYLGRIDAYVADSMGRDIGKIMIREKHARSYNGGKRAGWCDGSEQNVNSDTIKSGEQKITNQEIQTLFKKLKRLFDAI